MLSDYFYNSTLDMGKHTRGIAMHTYIGIPVGLNINNQLPAAVGTIFTQPGNSPSKVLSLKKGRRYLIQV